jgi:HEAT repeat protein
MVTQLERIQKLISQLTNTDTEAAQAAEHKLVEYGKKAVKPLIEAASDPNPAVRYRVVWALGKIGNPKAYETILALIEDPDEDVRYDAVMALGELGDERAMEPLLELIRSAAEQEVLSSAAGNALAALGDCAVKPLIGVMLTGSPDARVVAAYTLGHIASPETIEPMSDLLTDPNEWVRLAAVESLAQMAEHLPPVLASWCCQLIEQCVTDEVERVRETALYWSGELRRQVAVIGDPGKSG